MTISRMESDSLTTPMKYTLPSASKRNQCTSFWIYMTMQINISKTHIGISQSKRKEDFWIFLVIWMILQEKLSNNKDKKIIFEKISRFIIILK